MTKEVFITIEGIQFDIDEDAIEVKTSGEYHYRNGKHFIRYTELQNEGEGITENTIKIAPNQITITKKGANNTNMVFDANENSLTNYNTPFGSMLIGIHTTILQVKESEDEIVAKLLYTLDINDSHISDSSILIKINSKRENIPKR